MITTKFCETWKICATVRIANTLCTSRKTSMLSSNGIPCEFQTFCSNRKNKSCCKSLTNSAAMFSRTNLHAGHVRTLCNAGNDGMNNAVMQHLASTETETTGRVERRPHVPALVKEVVHIINPQPGQVLLDMTFGAGGHTRALLNRCHDVTVYALDRDPVAHRLAQQLALTFPAVRPLLGCFTDVPSLLLGAGTSQFDAVLFDTGASSMQFNSTDRGFSVSRDAPLDMRMDGNRISDEASAADVVNHLSEDGLCDIIKKYGEEKLARLIARGIVDYRHTLGRINTTGQLADIISCVYESKGIDGKRDKLGRHAHVATKTFQALRIFVNNELNELYNGLQVAHSLLRPGGVCVAITFHSLEDRIVKRHFHGIDMDAKLNMSVTDRARNPSVCHDRPALDALLDNRWQPVSRKVIEPTDTEVAVNPRARSAKLRAAVKLK